METPRLTCSDRCGGGSLAAVGRPGRGGGSDGTDGGTRGGRLPACGPGGNRPARRGGGGGSAPLGGPRQGWGACTFIMTPTQDKAPQGWPPPDELLCTRYAGHKREYVLPENILATAFGLLKQQGDATQRHKSPSAVESKHGLYQRRWWWQRHCRSCLPGPALAGRAASGGCHPCCRGASRGCQRGLSRRRPQHRAWCLCI